MTRGETNLLSITGVTEQLSDFDRIAHARRAVSPETDTPRYALLGVRACGLAALQSQDQILAENEYVDPAYRRRRNAALIIAVNFGTAASTCFCHCLGTGSERQPGFDIQPTEIDSGFVVQASPSRGEELVSELDLVPATAGQLDQAADQAKQAQEELSKQFQTDDLPPVLHNHLDYPQWDRVAQRCLCCGSCTMVCPTCFCSTVSEVANLAGTEVSRGRQWDSCFNIDFCRTSRRIVRKDIHRRYRQWLTHKLEVWIDQFGHSGCVGCGRCLTWCPVGFDLTEEVDAIRKSSP